MTKEAFTYVKKHKDEFHPWYVGATGYFPTYANKWMESYNEYNSPGTFKGSMKNVLKQDLAGIHLLHGDYKNIPLGKGNVIYCDPPYKHFDYYKMPFDHDEFCDWVRYASKTNIVYVSEYEMPSDFQCVWQMTITPGINHAAAPREEKLFIYRP